MSIFSSGQTYYHCAQQRSTNSDARRHACKPPNHRSISVAEWVTSRARQFAYSYWQPFGSKQVFALGEGDAQAYLNIATCHRNDFTVMGATTHLQKLSSAARAHLNELLDEALEETFPASDPIAVAVELETMEDKSSESQGHRKGSERGTHAQVSRQLRSAP